MVSFFVKPPGGRTSTRRPKHFLEDRVGGKRISPAAAPQGDKSFDHFGPAEVVGSPSNLICLCSVCHQSQASWRRGYYGGPGYWKAFDAEVQIC